MKKILIIKLGAKGDVVRTLSVLPAIKQKYPESEIYWITKENITDLLQNHPLISKVLASPYNLNEKFDILYNFDIEEEATTLAKNIKADEKYGFYSEEGYPTTFNLGAEYYLNTFFDDDLKKSNKKTYQEMIFKAVDLTYNKEHCTIYLDKEDKKYAEEFIRENNINTEKLIGIHMGAGPRWPSKAWAKEKIKEFIKAAEQRGYEILLFGGPDEIDVHQVIIQDLKKQGMRVHHNNPNNTDREFMSLVNICKKMICSDSFALHISLALKRSTIGLFFCTTPHEIEEYGLLKKIVSPKLYDFFPEKQDKYSEELINSISVEEVMNAVEE